MSTASRTPTYPIARLFLERWSPRAFDASSIPENDLFTMFEAARWAPSAFNAQPWRFLYAMRDDPYWAHFLSFLIPFNASWARNASALVYVLSETLILTGGELTPSHSHSFDAAQLGLCSRSTQKVLVTIVTVCLVSTSPAPALNSVFRGGCELRLPSPSGDERTGRPCPKRCAHAKARVIANPSGSWCLMDDWRNNQQPT